MSGERSSCACGWVLLSGPAPSRCPACGAQLGSSGGGQGQLGPYELLGRIGAGAMGQVFRARDRRQGREVALKLLLAAEASEAQRSRFLREGRALARVRHPNLVEFHEAGTHQGRLFLAMELVRGVSLSERTRERVTRPAEALRLGAELGRALGALHAAGILHRDVKPANVLLDERGAVRLVDLGLARGEALGQTRLTRTGALVGTPHYMAPEQFSATRELSPAVDVYALGSVLYELLTGRPPFLQESLLGLAGAVADETPEPPSRHGAEVGSEVDALVLSMLAKDPGQRPRDGDAAARALEELLAPAERQASARALPVFAFLVMGAFGLGVGSSSARPALRPSPAEARSERAPSRALASATPAEGAELLAALARAEAAVEVAPLGTATLVAEEGVLAALRALRAAGQASFADELRLFELLDLRGAREAEDLGRELLAGSLDSEARALILARLYGELRTSGPEGGSWVEDQIARLEGAGPQVCLARSVVAYEQDPSRALALTRAGLAQAPRDSGLRFQQASIYSRLGQVEEARRELVQIEQGATSPGWRAWARVARSAVHERVEPEHIEAAIRIHPGAYVLEVGAQLALLADDGARALELLQRAHELGRTYRFVRAPIFRELLRLGRWQELQQLTRRTLAEDPGWELAIRYGALAEAWLGNSSGALRLLARGVEASVGEQARRLSWLLATNARDLGDWEGAARGLSAEVEQRLPGSELAALLQAYQAEARGDLGVALEALEGGGPTALRRLAEVELRLTRGGRPGGRALLAASEDAARAAGDAWLLAYLALLEPEAGRRRALSRRASDLASSSSPSAASEVYVMRYALLAAEGEREVFNAFHGRLNQRLWQRRPEVNPHDLGHLARSVCIAWRRSQPGLIRTSQGFHSTALTALRLMPWSWLALDELGETFPGLAEQHRFVQGSYLPLVGSGSRLADLVRLHLVEINLARGYEHAAAGFLEATPLRAEGPLSYQTQRARYLSRIGHFEEAHRQVTELLRAAPNYAPARKLLEELGRAQ